MMLVKILYFYLLEILLFVYMSDSAVIERSNGIKYISRTRRNIDTNIENLQFNDVQYYVETTTASALTSTIRSSFKNIIPGNDLFVGTCSGTDKKVYVDNTIITNDGPSILNGTIEIYIDSPIKITCFHVIDQIKDGTGGKPSLNSGGIGYNWVKIDVVGKYGLGFHFKINVFGVIDEEAFRRKLLRSQNRATANLKTTTNSYSK